MGCSRSLGDCPSARPGQAICGSADSGPAAVTPMPSLSLVLGLPSLLLWATPQKLIICNFVGADYFI